MNTITRCVPMSLTMILAWAMLAGGARTALAEQAEKPTKEEAAKKRAALRAAFKAAQEKRSGKKATTGEAKPERKAPKGAAKAGTGGRIVVSKPVWNKEAGFGLPVPTGWFSKVQGTQIILTSPAGKAGQTEITLGPEPTELEANEYLGKLCKELHEKEKILAMVQPPRDVLNTTIYLAVFPDAVHGRFGAILVMDRPGNQVFVIRAFTRDESVLKDVSVLGALGMVRFRGEPPPLAAFASLLGFGEKKERLKLGEINVRPGKGTLAAMPMPDVLRNKAREIKFSGRMHRYMVGLAAPAGYNPDRSWPVLIVDAPATKQSIARFQDLADKVGVVVMTVQPQTEDTVWTPEFQAQIYFAAINGYARVMALDRTRVYVMGIGPTGKAVQGPSAIMPLTRGVICYDTKDNGLDDTLAKSPDAKKRLAMAAAYAPSKKGATPAQADALVEAWKKAGIAAAKACKANSTREAVRGALDWMLERDREVLKAELDALMARAEKIAPTQTGEALTIYRRIAGSGLKDERVTKAKSTADKLRNECDAIEKVVSTQPSGGSADVVIEQFEVAQRFQGSPEGDKLMRLLKPKLDAQ